MTQSLGHPCEFYLPNRERRCNDTGKELNDDMCAEAAIDSQIQATSAVGIHQEFWSEDCGGPDVNGFTCMFKVSFTGFAQIARLGPVFTKNRYQRHELGQRFGLTLCNFCFLGHQRRRRRRPARLQLFVRRSRGELCNATVAACTILCPRPIRNDVNDGEGWSMLE